MLDKRADPNYISKNVDVSMPLHESAKCGSIFCIKNLIRKGATVDAKCKKGKTSVHYACEGSSFDAIKILYEYGATLTAVDETGNTPMHILATKSITNDVENILELFIGENFDFNTTNNDLETPLMVARRLNNHDFVNFATKLGVIEEIILNADGRNRSDYFNFVWRECQYMIIKSINLKKNLTKPRECLLGQKWGV